MWISNFAHRTNVGDKRLANKIAHTSPRKLKYFFSDDQVNIFLQQKSPRALGSQEFEPPKATKR